jgi:rare lipoprotein A
MLRRTLVQIRRDAKLVVKRVFMRSDIDRLRNNIRRRYGREAFAILEQTTGIRGISLLTVLLSIFALLFTATPIALAGPDGPDKNSASSKVMSSNVQAGQSLTGKATIYPNILNGHKTSSGEEFHQSGHTAASNKLPLGTNVKVTNLENGKSTDIKVNDRGPALGKHKIDLSKRAAKDIGLTHNQGKVPVNINVTHAPPQTHRGW